jgi:folate-binding protein YgfZ
VFRSKVGVAVRDDLRVEGAFAPPSQARGDHIGGDVGAGVELDLGADSGARTLRILSVSTALHDPALGGRWAAFDLKHGLPRLPASQTDHWTPQQLSLDRINAFSVKKGCYPGQEIVARTHFLGKVKRGLALLEAASALRAGEDLRAAGEPLGHVVACADDGKRHLALAVVPLERAPAPLQVGDTDVWESPLGEGLAR